MSKKNTQCTVETPECLIADYRFIRLLGEGSTGKTYLAARRAIKKKVAVKELKVSGTYKSMELFERESAVLSSIKVPGVPKYYGFVKSPDAFGSAYLIQRYVPYPSLQKYLDDGKVFEESEVLGIIRKMADILDHLETDYSPAIIHRDIKPSNIMYDAKTGKVSLIDFGAVANPQKKTMGSTVAGTMGFMAPEQLMGDCTIQSDYYALGATALYLLTGVSPANMKHAADDPFKLEFETYLKRNVSKKMRQLLKLLLSVKSSDRPKNINVLKESLPAEKSDALALFLSRRLGWNDIKNLVMVYIYNLLDLLRLIKEHPYLYIEKLSGSRDNNDYYECSYKNNRGRYSLKIVDRSSMCDKNGGLWFEDKGKKYKVIDDHKLL